MLSVWVSTLQRALGEVPGEGLVLRERQRGQAECLAGQPLERFSGEAGRMWRFRTEEQRET